jgi:hypothetical protein
MDWVGDLHMTSLQWRGTIPQHYVPTQNWQNCNVVEFLDQCQWNVQAIHIHRMWHLQFPGIPILNFGSLVIANLLDLVNFWVHVWQLNNIMLVSTMHFRENIQSQTLLYIHVIYMSYTWTNSLKCCTGRLHAATVYVLSLLLFRNI